MEGHILALETDVKEHSFPLAGNLEAEPTRNPSRDRSSVHPVLTRGSLKVTSADRPLSWSPCGRHTRAVAELCIFFYTLFAGRGSEASLSF